MLRFFRPGDTELVRWVGIVQRTTIKTLFQMSPFSDPDLRTIIQFCYPTSDPVSGPISYVFRFKSITGDSYNGFCLLDQTSFHLRDFVTNEQSCICLISQSYHFLVFEDILKVLRSLLLHGVPSCKHFLEILSKSPQSVTNIPSLVSLVSIPLPNPTESHLATLSQFAVRSFSLPIISRLVLALLTDTPIIIVSSNLSILSQFSYSLLGLIAPLNWFHLFTPILPSNCLETIQSPTPFIVGLHRSLANQMRSLDIESHLFLDLDDGKLVMNGLDEIPNWVPNLKDGSPAALKKFMVLMLCNALKIQSSNSNVTTIKRIVSALKTVEFEANSFVGSLLTSRTLQALLDGIREPVVSQQYARLLAMGNKRAVTSPAVQLLDEFPHKKGIARSHSATVRLCVSASDSLDRIAGEETDFGNAAVCAQVTS
jgi:hypothetical protein